MDMYQNPLTIKLSVKAQPYDHLKKDVNPDPYVLKFNGQYYAYATALEGVAALYSTDLINWEHLGYVYQREQQMDYWAPAVFYDNGLFYLYVSSRPHDEEDVHYEYLQVAVSESPEGPFRYVKELFSTFSIDAHVVRDTDGGLVLFYSTNETLGTDEDRPGTVILADKLIDPFTLEGKPKLIVKPTLDEEIYEDNRFGDGRNWHTIEGAFHLQRRSKHYVMYSGNAFTKPYYYIGYSTARHQEGRSITELDWSKYPDEQTYLPMLRQNDQVEGVGHNSVVKAPNNIDDWVVYHGRERVEQAGLSADDERRQMRMDPLRWLGDEMWVDGPSSEQVVAPAQPGFRDLFMRPADHRTDVNHGDGADHSGKAGHSINATHNSQTCDNWRELSGEWKVRERELQQASVVGRAQRLLQPSYKAAWFEVNVRWEPHHMGGRYGAIVAYRNDRHYAEVLLDVGQRSIGLYDISNGIQLEPQTVQLPVGFRFDVYHQLLVKVIGNQLAVCVDGMELLTAQLHGLTESELPCFGATTHYTSAYFAGVALTGHLSWNAATSVKCASYTQPQKGVWKLTEGMLQGRTLGEGVAIALYNPFAESSSKLRFDLNGKLSESCLTLSIVKSQLAIQSNQVQKLTQGQRISLSLPQIANQRIGTVHVQQYHGRLQAWVDRKLILDEAWNGNIEHVGVDSATNVSIEALEWTALS